MTVKKSVKLVKDVVSAERRTRSAKNLESILESNLIDLTMIILVPVLV
jgi:hypothetical protein